MQIYDRYNDGHVVMDRLASKLRGGCEFLMSGEGSDGPFHSGTTSHFLRSSPSGKYHGLKANSVRAKVAVFVEDPEVNDRRVIARLLVEAYEKSFSNRIDFVHMLGELMEEPEPGKHDV